MKDAMNDANRAWNNFFIELGNALGIIKLLDWITRKLK